MHTVSTTSGFIVGSRPRGETGKLLTIFTREFGLIYASAQGLRSESSKLRYHTQDFSFGTYSLVRGKEYWRLTGADSTIRPFQHLNKAKSDTIARLTIILKRLLHGEEAHPEVFDLCLGCGRFLTNVGDLSVENLLSLESLSVARLLHGLGYVGDVAELNGYLSSLDLSVDLLAKLEAMRRVLNQHINKALKESML
jgi:DNA repair protein RecO